MTNPQRKFTEVQGIKLHYLEWGERGKPDLLLVHGWTSFAASWSAVAEHFQDRYRMIAPDLRGHGESDKPMTGYRLRDFAEDMRQLIEILELDRPSACGVCHTELDEIVGRTPPVRFPIVLGHQIVGRVVEKGPGVTVFKPGDRVGIAWIHRACGRCRFCHRGLENLCPDATFTGWDADGGYADQAVVPEAFAYRIPEKWSDVYAAPLLCAGIIGYRALRLASVPDGGRLGIYGFGASAQLTAQVAMQQGATVHVMTRSPEARALALSLGCASAGDTYDAPPEPLVTEGIYKKESAALSWVVRL